MKIFAMAALVCTIVLSGALTPCLAQTHNPQAQIHRDRADARNAKSDYLGAIREYEKAYALDKKHYPSDAANDLYDIGTEYADTSQYTKSIAFYRRTRSAYRALKDKTNEAITLANLGLAHDRVGHHKIALTCYQQALFLFVDVSSAGGAALALKRMAATYTTLHWYQKAEDAAHKVIRLYHSLADQDKESQAWSNLASLYDTQKQYRQAEDSYQQALPLYRALKDQIHEAETVSAIADDAYQLSEYKQAISDYGQALTLYRHLQDRMGEANALNNIGLAYHYSGQYANALDYYQQALPIYRELHNRRHEATTLVSMGITKNSQKQYREAVAYYRQALTLQHALHDSVGAASSLSTMGNDYFDLKQYPSAIIYYRQAIAIYQRTQQQQEQAHRLNDLGDCYYLLEQYPAALNCHRQALAINRGRGDQSQIALSAVNLGEDYLSVQHYTQAIDYCAKALALYRKVKDTEGQAHSLSNLGTAYAHSKQYDKGISCHRQALAIRHTAHQTNHEATELGNIGSDYSDLGQNLTALEYYQQALVLQQSLQDRSGQAGLLMSIGGVYNDLNQYGKAVDILQQALKLYRTLHDRSGEADTLNNLGNVYDNLGEYQKSVEMLLLALPIQHALHTRRNEARTLDNLGNAYFDLKQYDPAIKYHQQALGIRRSLHDQTEASWSLTNLGNVYYGLKQYHHAIGYYQQSLSLVSHGDSAATTLNNIGYMYDKLKQYPKSIRFYQRALFIHRKLHNRDGEATTLDNLMHHWRARHQPYLAIFYGKQAINVFQSMRQDIQSLDKDVQKVFLHTKEQSYRTLAELLIGQGRLTEAEQVLGMLKDQELMSFVQRDATEAPPATRTISYDTTEDAQKTKYDQLADPVTALGAQVDALQRKSGRTSAENAHLTALQDQLGTAQHLFQSFLDALPQELLDASAKTQYRGQKLADPDLSLQGQFQRALAALAPGTVALYTIIEPDKYRVVIFTSQTAKAEEYPIKDTDLRAKVAAFREALQDPSRDPRALGQELYKILIGPIENDLAGAKATTLMWSLDDVLRYLPIAALYDGKQYIVERYRTTVFTGASLPGLTQPSGAYKVLALGVSQAHPRFPALPGVPQELHGIVKNGSDSAGVIDGTVLLDDQFTWEAMKTDLNQGYSLVHIASHFALGKDYATSFLLLGDGPRSLDQIRSSGGQMFQKVDLLTLSACETAVGGLGGDGHEVESFGMLAQSQGALSIMASLWPVADSSTPLLMDHFYAQLASGSSSSKAEALRQAQLSLLNGTNSGSADNTQRAEIVSGKKGNPVTAAPPFTPDPKAPFAHPYYWASFILIGNWK